jgi:hypothetical protein
MTYQELIDNIRDLGFSEDSEIEEFGEVVNNGINRAISTINLDVAPIIKTFEFELTDDDEGYVYYIMPEIDETFLEFADNPIMIGYEDTQYYKRFGDYEIESDNTMVVNADECKGKFRVFYKAEHTHFTGAEDELSDDLPLPLKAHYLVPLLSAYYIWLEDEPTKAAQYYNMYEQEAATLNARTNRLKVRVVTEHYHGY